MAELVAERSSRTVPRDLPRAAFLSFHLPFRRSHIIAALPPRFLAIALALGATATQSCGGGGGDGGGGTQPPPVAVASITIAPSPLNVTAGLTSQLTATPKSAAGAALSGRQINWSSADQTIATVSASGLVTGVKAGSTTVTATSEGVHQDVAVTVNATAVASIDVTPSPLSVTLGQTAQLTATPKSATGVALTDRQVAWSTVDGTIASVSTSGLVTGAKVGTTTITATSEGVHTDVAVTVAAPVVASIIFATQPPASVAAGATIAPAVQVQLLDGSGNVITSSNASVTITLTGGTSGASLTGTATANAVNGVATFSNLSIKRKGTAYHLVASGGGVQGTSAAFDISAAAATSIAKLAGDAQTVIAGTTLQPAPSVQLTDAFGNGVNGATVTFTPASGSGSVAAGSVVTDANGIATVGSWTVGAMGPNTLTATAGALSATFSATVTGAVTPGIQFVVGVQGATIGALGSPSSSSVAVGHDITIPLTLDLTNRGSADLGAIQLTINWDPSLLTFKSESAGDWTATQSDASVSINTGNAGTGIIRIAGFATNATVTSFVLRNLVFTGSGTGSVNITATITAAGNAAGTTIPVGTRPLAVTVTP
jgi:hypothetical protein